MRSMIAEHRLHPSDFILPMFICEGSGCEEPIASLNGVSRWSVDRIGERAVKPPAMSRVRDARFNRGNPPVHAVAMWR